MKKTNAIVCYYQEKYGSILDIALNRHKKYANKCRCDFIGVILSEQSTDPQMDKFFHISESLSGYNRYLIVDIDILIRQDSPNLFEIVNENKVAIYNEGATFLTNKYHETHEILVRWHSVNDLVKTCKLEPCNHSKIYGIGMPFVYYNSGVVMFGGENKNLYKGFNESQKKLLYGCFKDVQCSEQALVNYFILNKSPDVHSLPVCFNQMSYNRCSDYLNTCYFSHYAGMSLSDKTEQMIKDHKHWEQKGL